ncbi:hypothetical protein GE09DRAFT_980820 [Coniochaeta sp. 2T2.1]|nr:hypothetical protein GE09DRAFT_980820 [Coniochaeta sp. 2T2.1]
MASPQQVERHARRRTAVSCDRCKARKTKCVDPVPGPCQFCADIGAACHLDPSRRKQRPYYRVSEEEFRYMTRILEHFLPNTDLNLQTLKELATSLGSGQPEQCPTSVTNAAAALSPASSGLVPSHKSGTEQDMVAVEIDKLHQRSAWLWVDSKGIYRHVGANSSYLFLDAVRCLNSQRPARSPESEVLSPLSAASPLPPPTPEAAARIEALRQICLPHRDLGDACVARFFRDIQSVYWFFSAEALHATLDRIYSGDAAAATPAVLCALYSIFALTSESQVEREGGGAEAESRPGVKYLALAKSFVPALCDDGDIDSVRALCLLALALSSSMFGVTAYVYIGAAARIAFTLGLHSHGDIGSRHSLQRQADLRLFCTLYLLDLEAALCFGQPSAIGEDIIPGDLMLPSEDILSPGSNMPLHYLEVSCKLGQLKRDLSRLVYSTPMSNNPKISIPALSSALSSLREWYSELPPHLRDYRQAATFHYRSVAVLHLRYWGAIAFATRPFLLYSVSRCRKLPDAPKLRHFDDFGAACIAAAEKSLEVIAFLREWDLLSSLIPLDCTHILECMQVFMLALAETKAEEHVGNVKTCLHTLRGMEQILWPRHALTEVMAQMEKQGIWEGADVLFPGGLIFPDVAPLGDL